jgi:hypothetical protein
METCWNSRTRGAGSLISAAASSCLSSVTGFTGTNVQILTRCAGPQVGRLSDKRRRLQLKITHARAAWAARASVVTWAVTASCPRPVASSAQARFTFAFYVLLYSFCVLLYS